MLVFRLELVFLCLEDSVRMATRCRNRLKFDICHELYLIKRICWLIHLLHTDSMV